MVMMVMVVRISVGSSGVAVHFVAMLPLGLQLQRGMMDPMLRQLLPNGFLDSVRFAVGHNVQSGVMVVSIQAPNVDMVCIQHAVHLQNMLAQLINVHAVRNFLQKEIQRFLQVADGVGENKERHANGEQ